MKQSGDLVFPGGRQGKPLSDMALSEVVRRMNEEGEEGALPRWRDAEGRAVVPHGFRSTFRDWAGETRPEGREVVEAALAHTMRDKAEAAYARSDLLEKRRVDLDRISPSDHPGTTGQLVQGIRRALGDAFRQTRCWRLWKRGLAYQGMAPTAPFAGPRTRIIPTVL